MALSVAMVFLPTPRDRLLALVGVTATILLLASLLVFPRRFAPNLTETELDQINITDPRERFELQESRRRLQNDVRATFLQAIGGAAILAGLLFTWQQLQADRDQQLADQVQLREQLTVTRQGQAAERFTRAIDQLGDSKLEIKLGGIYALERLAKTTTDHNDRLTIYDVLAAYVRQHAPRAVAWTQPAPKKPTERLEDPPPPLQDRAPDTQAALTVLGRRDSRSDDPPIDLHDVDLHGADLTGANLQSANFTDVNLEGADLTGANLREANLLGADLHKARLVDADLGQANLRVAYLSQAILTGANLAEAVLNHAKLEITDLRDANLQQANVAGADLEAADLRRANLQGAALGAANLQHARLTTATLQGADFSRATTPEGGLIFGPSDLRHANLDGADLRGANLRSVRLEEASLRGATADRSTTWPPNFDWRPAGIILR